MQCSSALLQAPMAVSYSWKLAGKSSTLRSLLPYHTKQCWSAPPAVRHTGPITMLWSVPAPACTLDLLALVPAPASHLKLETLQNYDANKEQLLQNSNPTCSSTPHVVPSLLTSGVHQHEPSLAEPSKWTLAKIHTSTPVTKRLFMYLHKV